MRYPPAVVLDCIIHGNKFGMNQSGLESTQFRRRRGKEKESSHSRISDNFTTNFSVVSSLLYTLRWVF